MTDESRVLYESSQILPITKVFVFPMSENTLGETRIITLTLSIYPKFEIILLEDYILLFTMKELDRSYKAKELQGKNALKVLTSIKYGRSWMFLRPESVSVLTLVFCLQK